MNELPALIDELIQIEKTLGPRNLKWQWIGTKGQMEETYYLKTRRESISQLILTYLNGHAFIHGGVVFVPGRDQDDNLEVQHYPLISEKISEVA